MYEFFEIDYYYYYYFVVVTFDFSIYSNETFSGYEKLQQEVE